jgi:DNA-binding PucR family transcriptional regulator
MATSIKNVAAELFIHPNTVLWRKQKIEEILSCDMENIDVRSEINIAFKLMRVRNFLQIAR